MNDDTPEKESNRIVYEISLSKVFAAPLLRDLRSEGRMLHCISM